MGVYQYAIAISSAWETGKFVLVKLSVRKGFSWKSMQPESISDNLVWQMVVCKQWYSNSSFTILG